MKLVVVILAVCLLATVELAARADKSGDLRAAMEANGAKWLQAYNTQDAKTLAKIYAEDASVHE